jgi:methyl-accepting chemotaxis protein
LQITLGEKLLPVLTELLNNYIAPGINAVTGFADAFFAAADPVAFLATQVDGLVPGLGSVVTFISQFVDQLAHADEWSSSTAETIATLTAEIIGFVAGVQTGTDAFWAIQEPIESVVTAAESLGAFLLDNLGPILSGVAAMIIANVVPAFVTWATTAGTAAATTIAALLPVIAPIAAIGLAAAALYAAWDSDFLGIRTALTSFWDRYGQPIFEEVTSWLAKTIPQAISTASTFFTDTLLPALSGIWSFLSTYVIPIFEALFKVQFAVAQKVVEALAGVFQNVLLPAFTSASNYLGKTLQPALAAIGDFITGTLGPIFERFTGWLGNVTGGFGGISDAVSGLIKWLNDLADKITNLKLPDWATPGSPTPAEIGFKGMARALRVDLVPEFQSLISTLQVAPIASPTQIAANGMRQQVTNYNGPVGPQYNLGVTTNQSPAVVQQGYYTMRALSGS